MKHEQNPYSPPTSVVLEAEERDYPWYVAARGIYVRDGATLPPIDLRSGEETESMTPVKHILPSHPGKPWKSILATLIVVAVVLPLIETSLALKIAAAIATALILYSFTKKRESKLQLTLYVSTSSKKRKNNKLLWQATEMVSFILSVTCLAFVFTNLLALVPFLLFTWLGRIAMKRKSVDQTGELEIRQATGPHGWIRIGNAHPDALVRLEEIQNHRGPLEI